MNCVKGQTGIEVSMAKIDLHIVSNSQLGKDNYKMTD